MSRRLGTAETRTAQTPNREGLPMTTDIQPHPLSADELAADTGAQALAHQLKAYGVEYVFGTCGHTNIALLAAFDEVGIEFVIARHEQAAAHAADGYARMS